MSVATWDVSITTLPDRTPLMKVALVVVHYCREVRVGIADIDRSWIAALDLDLWGSGGAGDSKRRRCTYLDRSLLCFKG